MIEDIDDGLFVADADYNRIDLGDATSDGAVDADDTDNADDEEDLIGPTSRRNQIGRNKTVIMPHTVMDRVLSLTDSKSTFPSDSELADIFVSAFNCTHTIDRFYPGHEPMPGTMCCRFCGIFLRKTIDPPLHAKQCALKALANSINECLDRDFPIVPCTWYNKRNKGPCDKVFPDFKKYQWHIRNHVSRANLQCEFADCAYATPTRAFVSLRAFWNHVAMVHKVCTSGKKGDGKSQIIERDSQEHIFWCYYCAPWISRLTEDLEAHAATHKDLVRQFVTTYGYRGLRLGKKVIFPPLCPFCLHDDSMELWERFQTPYKFWTLQSKHLGLHFDGDQMISRCPASLDSEIAGGCAATHPMSPQELMTHLYTVHQLEVEHPDSPQTKRAIEDAEANPRMGAQGKRRILEPISVNQPLMKLLRGPDTQTQDCDENHRETQTAPHMNEQTK